MHFKTAFVALLASTVASPVPGATNSPAGLQARQDDPDGEWAGFHELTREFEKTGNCRIYIKPGSGRDGKYPCYEYCKSIGEEGGALGCSGQGLFKPGTTEWKDPTTVLTTPDGLDYAMGECICSNYAKEKIAEIAGEVLIILGQQVCATWLEATKASVELLTYVPNPGSAVAGAIKSLAKITSKIASVDEKSGAGEFETFVTGTCGAEDWGKVDFGAAFKNLVTSES